MPPVGPSTVLYWLITFTTIIAVHEFGHYLVARFLGMKVLEFAFGFPPRAASFMHAGIRYSVNWIPFGGFVRILGQDDFSIEQQGEGDPGSFTSRPWWAQALVLVAGVTMNVVLAMVLFTVAFATGGTAPTGDVKVDQVAVGSPAEKTGLQVGDIVRSIDGRPITRSADLVNYVRQKARTESEVTLEIERNGRPIPAVKAVPRADPPEGQGPLGIRLEDVQGPVMVGPSEALRQALSLTGDVLTQIAALPSQLLSAGPGGDGPQVSGPIGIFQATAQVAEYGLPTFLKFVGVLSLNLAVLNIIPFPGLDGGRLLFVLIGAISGRRLSPQVEAAIHALGFVVLIGLLLVVSFFDIRRVVGG
jgi:regulator of sigma E protease